jgi:hypothetical protein
LSRECYFSVDLFILADKFKKDFYFFQSRSVAEPLATYRGTVGFRGTPVEKPWSRLRLFSWLSSLPSGKVWSCTTWLAVTASFYVLSNSFFIDHPIIPCYTVYSAVACREVSCVHRAKPCSENNGSHFQQLR